MSEIVYEVDSYTIMGICYEVYNQLGSGFLEIVYKDALEYEFSQKNIFYEREKVYKIKYKEIILPHQYIADFIIMNKIVFEVKAIAEGIPDVFVAQALNYLKVSGNKLALIVNFGKDKVESRRIVL